MPFPPIGAAVNALSIPQIAAFQQGDSTTGTGSASRLITGAGLTKVDPTDISTWTHGNTWQNGWQGTGFDNAAANPVGWLALDLGKSISFLQDLYIWNVNESGAPLSRGVKDYRIYYSDNPTVLPSFAPQTSSVDYDFVANGWTLFGGNRTLSQGSGLTTQTYNAAIDLRSISSARYIGFEFQSNYGATSPARIGLAELVITVPEPSRALLAIGGVLPLLFRRRR